MIYDWLVNSGQLPFCSCYIYFLLCVNLKMMILLPQSEWFMTDWLSPIYGCLVSRLHIFNFYVFNLKCWYYCPGLNDLWLVNSDLWLFSFSVTCVPSCLCILKWWEDRPSLKDLWLTGQFWFRVYNRHMLIYTFLVLYWYIWSFCNHYHWNLFTWWGCSVSQLCLVCILKLYTSTPVWMIYDWYGKFWLMAV